MRASADIRPTYVKGSRFDLRYRSMSSQLTASALACGKGAAGNLLPRVFTFFGLTIFWTLLCVPLLSQDTLTNQGTRFWCSFLPNYHNRSNDRVRTLEDSLFIVISSRHQVRGRLWRTDSFGVQQTIPFTIPSGGGMYRYGVPWTLFELRGYNAHGSFVSPSTRPMPMHFRVETDSSVSAYAISHAETTTDAMMLLPEHALDTEYTVVSYHSDTKTSALSSLTGQSTPSQFLVLATEDSTVVRINPTTPVSGFGAAPYTVVLSRGQSHLAQASQDIRNTRTDLTGTIVSSNRPVVVIAGHQRAAVPNTGQEQVDSRDMLLEQMIPNKYLGMKYQVVPFRQPSVRGTDQIDLYRIVATDDNTIVTSAGARIAVLRRGQFFQDRLQRAFEFTASKPVLVGVIKGSSQFRNDTSTTYGDPFLIVLPARRQYLSDYQVLNVQTYQSTRGSSIDRERVYFEHYITVTIPTAYAGTLRLDGRPLGQVRLEPITGSCYSYMHIPVSEGAHQIEAERPFGCFIYGYGDAVSYGYLGGMAMRAEAEVFPAVAGSSSICPGDSTVLRAQNAFTYRWDSVPGLSCYDCSEAIAKTDVSRWYPVTMTDWFGCQTRDSVRVTVLPLPLAEAGPDTMLCVGESTRLTARGGVSYRWEPVPGLSCYDCPQPDAVVDSQRTFVVTVFSNDGCSAKDSVTVGLHPTPQYIRAVDTTVCRGDTVRVRVTTVDSILWDSPVELSCFDCPAPLVRPTDAVTLRYRLTNSFGCTRFDSIVLNVRACKRELTARSSGDVVAPPCDSALTRVVLLNTGELPIEISRVVVEGRDSLAFQPTGSMSQPVLFSGAADTVWLMFTPLFTGQHRARCTFYGSNDEKVAEVDLFGLGQSIALRASMADSVAINPGDTVWANVSISSDQWEHAQVRELRIDFRYPETHFFPLGNLLRGPIIDSTWSVVDSLRRTNGKGMEIRSVRLNGLTSLERSGYVASVPFLSMLGDSLGTVITLDTLVADGRFCLEPEGTGSILVNLKSCASAFRRVRFGESYGASIHNSSGAITFAVRIGLRGPCTVEIVDLMGKVQRVISREHLEQGVYEFSIPSEDLAHGAYIARVLSGPSVISVPFLHTRW